MMRKLVSQGNSAFTVTLPVSWIRDNGLKKGDELLLERKGKELIINSSAQPAQKKAEVDLIGRDEIIEKSLAILYKKGINELHIKFSNESSFKKIEQIIQKYLPGFEITEFTKSECTIKDFSHYQDYDPNQAVRITLRLIESEVEHLIKCFKSGELEQLRNIGIAEDSINRVTTLFRRLAVNYSDNACAERVYSYGIIRNFESIGDDIKLLAYFILESKKARIGKESQKALLKIQSMLMPFYHVYENGELKDLLPITELGKEVSYSIMAGLKKPSTGEKEVLMILLGISRRLYESYMYAFGIRL